MFRKRVHRQADFFARQKHLHDVIKEVFRKSIHLCSALVPLLLRWNAPAVQVALCLLLIGYTVTESLRRRGKNVPVVSVVTSLAARKRDENKFVLGPITLVVGILAASFMWPQFHAAVGIYALAFGDGLASLAGRLFGRIEIPLTHGKTAEGSLTCFCAIFIAGFLHTRDAGASLVIAFAGMLIELLPLKDFDNILIPVALGGLSYMLL